MLEYFRRVEETGEVLIVISHNRPVIRIEAIGHGKSLQEVFGKYWGRVSIPDDIMEF